MVSQTLTDDRLDADGDGLPDGCDPEPEIPGGMALVPAGPFAMGDPFGTGAPEERPVHTIEVSAFFADQHEVSWALWQEVRAWAVEHGYELGPGAGKGADHPVQMASWYDAVKWCNARSERAGLTPVYRTAAGEVYRTGDVDLRSEDVLWTANGFRLATEAEWEKAARGGLVRQQYPWGNQVDGSLANYGSSGDAYEVGAKPWTTPVGLYVANGYGLYDMAGNVFEWCWDWWDAGWYSTPEAVQADPRGPTAAGAYRVARGGSWFWTPYAMRCSYRGWDEPRYRGDGTGLRCVRSQTVSGNRVLDLARVMAEPGLWLAAGEAPTVEYAAAATGPWQEDSYALITAGADGGWEAIAGDGGARFFRLVKPGDGELPYCALVLGPAVRLESISGDADADADTVPDCEDTCLGHDNRADGDGDQVPDGCDRCPGHDDRADADADKTPNGCDLCLGFSDRLYGWIDENSDRIADCAQAPATMVWIAPGTFSIGDTFAEGEYDERPVHLAYISAFFMDRYEVTKEVWDEVRDWALAHGYSFQDEGAGKGENHPVFGLCWYDAVVWCNARSEKDDLTPVYRMQDGTVYRAGRSGLSSEHVLWSANGYRLPTEAEWEKAARGGLTGKRFPWGDTISHSQANYKSSEDYPYDISPTRGYHPDYDTGHPSTSPVGSFPPNGYGLHDMEGNVAEWCWDGSGLYPTAPSVALDPRGSSYSRRVVRGGSCHDYAYNARCSRRQDNQPGVGMLDVGFRCVRRQAPRDSDFDRDGSPDRADPCPLDPTKVDPGICGCGVPDRDTDLDGALDCVDACPQDHSKIDPGECGCGIPDTDTDGDGEVDCKDRCPNDPAKTWPGQCGCGVSDVDSDGDEVSDFRDACPGHDDRVDTDLDGIPDACDNWVDPDGDGASGSEDKCPGADDRIDQNGNGIPDACDPAFELRVTLPGGAPLVLRRIPAGTFEMGSSTTERSREIVEGPVHKVTIGYDFYMGKYEVTQGQWRALMGSNPSRFREDTSRPVEQVSWNDAKDFIAALNAHIVATGQGPLTVRLPSEAEWEYACRAGTQTRFCFGDSLSVGEECEDDRVRSQYMWYCGNDSPYGTHRVGTRLPNAFGLYDMHGNVREWCEDWYHSWYSGAPVDGSAWVAPAASARVRRGGGWRTSTQGCRSAYRYGGAPTDRHDSLGLRLAAVQ